MREKIKFYGSVKTETDIQVYCVQDKITGIKNVTGKDFRLFNSRDSEEN